MLSGIPANLSKKHSFMFMVVGSRHNASEHEDAVQAIHHYTKLEGSLFCYLLHDDSSS